MTLKDFSIDEMITWRNCASERVNINDRVTNQLINEAKKLQKKNHKDLIWIQKLNKEINHRAFGYKKEIFQIKM